MATFCAGAPAALHINHLVGIDTGVTLNPLKLV